MVVVLTISLCASSGSAESGAQRDRGHEGTQDRGGRAGAEDPLGDQGRLRPRGLIGVHDLCHLCADESAMSEAWNALVREGSTKKDKA